MKSWSLTFATQMLFRRSWSEVFDTFKNIILRGPAVEKHWPDLNIVDCDFKAWPGYRETTLVFVVHVSRK